MPTRPISVVAGNSYNSIAAKPQTRATKQLSNFAFRKADLLSARSGMEAWPSWEMLLARRTGNGTMPAA